MTEKRAADPQRARSERNAWQRADYANDPAKYAARLRQQRKQPGFAKGARSRNRRWMQKHPERSASLIKARKTRWRRRNFAATALAGLIQALQPITGENQ
jgi:hypothetical protein